MIQVKCDLHERTFQLADAIAGRRVRLFCGCVHRVPGEIAAQTGHEQGSAAPPAKTSGHAEAPPVPIPAPEPASGLGELAEAVAGMRRDGKEASGKTAFDAAAARTATAVKGTISVLKLLVKDPTALDLAANVAGKPKTRDTGLVCGALFIGAILVSVFRLTSAGPVDLPVATYLRLAIVPLTVWGGLAVALSVSRRLFATRAEGCIENDLFGAGITTVPLVLAIVVAQLLGGSPKALMLVGGAVAIWSVLILFSALTRLARVPSGLALYTFPLIILGELILTGWVIQQLNLAALPL